MADGTSIQWCDATFNPWIGCTKVSPACDGCYAETWGKRFGVEWGNHPRRRTSTSYWNEPLKWDRKAREAGARKRVFCASLADWLDNQVDPAWRQDLGALMARTPNLDWLLLTKRPQNYEGLAPWPANDPPPNIWLGTTTENQEEADRRIPQILRWPAAVHFISAEPLVGPIDLEDFLDDSRLSGDGLRYRDAPANGLDWVITGGESGPGARAANGDWYRDLRDQCCVAAVPFHFKQHGEWIDVADLRNLPGGSGPGFGAFDHCEYDQEHEAVRVGKKAAGRALDGREWNEMPA